MIFHTSDTSDAAVIQNDICDGRELCMRGVTTGGVAYEACNFAE